MPKAQKSTGKYITLKEAAHISGYAADYIGQLIRKGKLPGRRIFLNEAWVTTEDDVRSYMASETGSRKSGKNEALFEKKIYQRFMAALIYIGLAVGIATILFGFYVFSSILDQALQKNAIHILQSSPAAQSL